MNVVLFGGTGTIGSGALIESLKSPEVARVLSITRRPTGRKHAKLEEVLHEDFLDYGNLKEELRETDACFFCLGVSAAGKSEEDYRRITFDFTVAAAAAVLEANPRATFIYISGAGADSTGTGRIMWARVRGQLEHHLLGMGLGGAYIFRPAYVQPIGDVAASTAWYAPLYKLTKPFYPVLRKFPNYVTSTTQIGQALLRVARDGHELQILECGDINEAAAISAVADRGLSLGTTKRGYGPIEPL